MKEPLIAVFMTDISTGIVGALSFRQFSLRTPRNEMLFCEADETIREVFPSQSNFTTSLLLIVTWYRVPPYSYQTKENTFQAILATDGFRSFAVFNYEDIQWIHARMSTSSDFAQVGFDAADDSNFYTIPASFTEDTLYVHQDSNIGIRGRWVFRIDQPIVEIPGVNSSRNASEITKVCATPDGSQCLADGNPQGCTCLISPPQCSCSEGFFGLDCSSILFPFGFGDELVLNKDDGSSGEIPIPIEFPFFGRDFNSLYVNTNGLITFVEENTGYTPTRFPLAEDIPGLAVYWGDVDTGEYHPGSIMYRHRLRNSTRDAMLFLQADEIIRQVFPGLSDFSSTWMLVATWHKVAFHDADDNDDPAAILNTFQVVLLTNGVQSFAMLNYDNITWTTGGASGGNESGLGGDPAQVGFDASDGINYYEVPGSGSDDIVNIDGRSNINTTGRWLFRIDLHEIQGPVVIRCPTADAVNVTSGSGLGSVTWTPSRPVAVKISDNTPVPASCSIPNPSGGDDIIVTSDYLFPAGTTRVTCDAPTATCRFDVVVFDNEAPIFQSCESQIVWITPGVNESIVVWDSALFAVVDAVDGPVSASCSFVNGNLTRVPVGLNNTLPLGLTTVDCEASDAAGNNANCQFTVTLSASSVPTTDQTDSASEVTSTDGRISTTETTEFPTTANGMDVLFPFIGPDVIYVPSGDDETSGEVHISIPFPFLGRNYTSFYVNTNGVISFNDDLTSFPRNPIPLMKEPLIAVFMTDTSTEELGSLSFRQFSLRTPRNEMLFCEADETIREVFPNQSNFTTSLLLIVTWYRVPPYVYQTSKAVENTFQAILATDGFRSFAVFNYEDIQWIHGSRSSSSEFAQVGFDAADGSNFYTIPASFTEDTLYVHQDSNIGIRGRWVFRIDQPIVEIPGVNSSRNASEIAEVCATPDGSQCLADGNPQGCTCLISPPQCSCSEGFFGLDCSSILFPFGFGDKLVLNKDDGSSGEIPIPIEFPFFGRDFNSLYVNTNGLITFVEENTGFTFTRFPLAEDIPGLAVYWGDVDTGEYHPGSIMYRHRLRNSTRDAMLFLQADEIIRQVFPGLSDFSSTWMLVATWHKVAFHDADDNDDPAAILNTFQVVLLTNGVQSFAMLNYDNITWTTGGASGGNESGLGGDPAQVGFDASDGINYYEVPGSGSDDIVNIDGRSNINTTGRWLFRIDLHEIQGPVVIRCPTADAVNITSGSGLGSVTWTPSRPVAVKISDNTPVPASCSIPNPSGGDDIIVTSDYLFPAGTTRVTCDAPTATCRFDVVVFDNEVPIFQSCESQIVWITPGVNESIVVWDSALFAVVDAVDGPVSASCSFVNGNLTRVPVGLNNTLPLGLTTVDCEASDAAGNDANCQFTVTLSASSVPTTDQTDSASEVTSTDGRISTTETTEFPTTANGMDVLFPFIGPDVIYVPSGDDETSGEVHISIPFPFLGRNYTSFYVNTNGVISFNDDLTTFPRNPIPLMKEPLIAVFMTDISTEELGSLSLRQFSLRTPQNEMLFCEADETIREVFPSQCNFTTSLLLIVTWYRVPPYVYHTEGVENTFQAILATDGFRSFAVFNYEDIQWIHGSRSSSPEFAQVGFDAADDSNFYTIPASFTEDTLYVHQDSNIGIRGRWVFRIDQPIVEIPGVNSSRNASEIAEVCATPDGSQCLADGNPQGCTCLISPPQCSCSEGFFGLDCSSILFPFGFGDELVLNLDDDSSGEIPIPIEFPFFGRDFNSLYVNTNGLITFVEENTGYTPTRFPLAEDIPGLAVYWSDVDTGEYHPGSIMYRHLLRNSTRDAMLFLQADEIIRQVFPGLSDFSSTWMLVATWHKVAFHDADDNDDPAAILNTFQVVLLTNGVQSFAMLNYDNITWTTGGSSGGNESGLGGNPAQVGFDASDGINYYEVPGSGSDDIVNIDDRSNINTTGRWLFRIDLNEIQGPVVIRCPTADAVNVTSGSGLGSVTWTPSRPVAVKISDNTPVPASCSIPNPSGGDDIIVTSDYLFPAGTTRVTCDAPTATCRFDVVVFDNEAPIFQSCESQIVWITPGVNESIVVWDSALFAVVDAVDGPVPASCSFVNGNLTRVPVGLNNTLPLGLTTLHCEASDAAGNNANCQFTVTLSDSPVPTTDQTDSESEVTSTDGRISTTETTEFPTTSNGMDVLFPFIGPDVIYVPSGDDETSGEVHISIPFPFLGRNYTSFYVNTNGVISFNDDLTSFPRNPIPLMKEPLIAVFMTDTSTEELGSLSFRQFSLRTPRNEMLFCEADETIREVFPNQSNFTTSLLLIVTWYRVPPYVYQTSKAVENTFQAILATDGFRSFAVFNYEDIQWIHGSRSSSPEFAQVGFDAADDSNFYTIPASFTEDTLYVHQDSNIGIRGRWVFRIDQPIVEIPGVNSSRNASEIAEVCATPDGSQCLADGNPQGCTCLISPHQCSCSEGFFGLDCSSILFPFGFGDELVLNKDDGSSGEIPIPIEFPFFGRDFNSLYVNTNGLITFVEENTGFTFTRFPLAEDIPGLAVYWGDVDTGEYHPGSIMYRHLLRNSTRDAMLFLQADEIIRQVFPGLSDFSSTWMLVATWHKVAFHDADDNDDPAAILNTFQVVLLTNGVQSFAMLNYDNITWTTGGASGGNESGLGGDPAQVGFDASDGINYYEVPGSGSDDIVNIDGRSNINTTGRWLFRIDLHEIQGPVVIRCPTADAVNITSGSGLGSVTWTPSRPVAVKISDNTPVPASCSIPNPSGGDDIIVTSDYLFPAGTTRVTCDAPTATCRFDVVVFDNEAPIFQSCESQIVWITPGVNESIVVWDSALFAVVDAVDGPVPASCSFVNGNLTRVPVGLNNTLPLGLTTLHCEASDAAGNNANCQFTVTLSASSVPTTDQTDSASEVTSTDGRISTTETTEFPTTANGMDVLFPFIGPDVIYVPSGDDETSGEVHISIPFPFLGRNYTSFYVNTNGVISFNDDLTTFPRNPIPLMKEPLIAVFMTDISTEELGSLSLRQFSLRTPQNEMLFCEADETIREVFPSQCNFTTSLLLIVTWYRVPPYVYHTEGVENTFQAILATDGFRSFAVFNYEDIQWIHGSRSSSPEFAQVGFDAADGSNFYTIPASFTEDTLYVHQDSNIGIRGRWVFRIDQPIVEIPGVNSSRNASEIAEVCATPDGSQCLADGNPQGCTCLISPPQCSCSEGFFGLDCSSILFPFGFGDELVLNLDDDSSGEIPIPIEFPFFGRDFNSLYVNTNGLITFVEENTGYTPTRFPLAEDIPGLAVYWSDVDTGEYHPGSIMYRHLLRNSTRDAMLFLQADEIIRQVFPGLSDFSSTWMLVATWHKVAFHDADDNDDPAAILNTFQVVLLTNGVQSFAMLNYDNITWTTGGSSGGNESGLGGNPAQVGFDASDGINYYEVPGSGSDDIVNIDDRSNINTTGRWLFRIDLNEIQGPVVIRCPTADAVNVTSGSGLGSVTWTPSRPVAVKISDNTPVPASCSIPNPSGGDES
ncbi:uncharacterized protein LOC119741303 [Patiria miniata]|uniref:Sushi, nidogen and EGF-like domain-containing protein 1 n=1 Tax=Patiria miniata TaxID=46514 RepID=A0A914BC20_PATMI|nr:uncharacterized protein LOC119741303 [Patiria miniata]